MILRTKGVTIGALGTKRHSKEILRETLASQTLAKLLVQVVYFGLGVLASRGTVFGRLFALWRGAGSRGAVP